MPTHHHNHHHDNPSPPPPKPNSKLLFLLLKSIIMALVLSLFLLFLGLTTLALLHLLLATSSLHRRRPTSPHSSYSPDDLQKHLPRLKYGAVSKPNDCAVCLEGLKEGEWCRTLPDCNHIFHLSCIDRWLTKVPNCPICRARVRLNSGGSGSIISDYDGKILWAVAV